LRAKGLSDFNLLMREAMKELAGRADGKVVGDIVKKKLTSA
jgi:Glu-tRNA(Gln) amidotransferase subunit E-like FAD-binding protein